LSKVRQIFTSMPERYISGKVSASKSYYFSVGDQKWSVTLHPDRCEAVEGKSGTADVVLKADPKLFERMVLERKMPGPLDIARGKIKTNDPGALQELMSCFRMP
jgi:hypothetical protein